MIEFGSHFCLVPLLFEPPSSALAAYHLERDRMPLHDAVWVNCENGSIVNSENGSLWAKGCMVIIVRSQFDLT